jgi:small subunit ribosomal protein S1
VEAVVLAVDPERERISLGIKQLDKDPFSNFVADHPKGTIVNGTVVSVDAKGAVIDLGSGVEGTLRASELSRERIDDARTVLGQGEAIDAKFVGVDRKNRTITLSVKAKEYAEEAEVLQDYSRKSTPGTATLGDLLKEQMGSGDQDE